MESTASPVFAVPVEVQMKTPDEIKRVAYLTNFDQKDLITLIKQIELIGAEGLKFILFMHPKKMKHGVVMAV